MFNGVIDSLGGYGKDRCANCNSNWL